MTNPNVNIVVSGPKQASSTYKTKVLKGNHDFESQVTDTDTKYVIKYDFDLGGESVTIPRNCILEFDGGVLSNGTVDWNECTVVNYNNYNCISGISEIGSKHDQISDAIAMQNSLIDSAIREQNRQIADEFIELDRQAQQNTDTLNAAIRQNNENIQEAIRDLADIPNNGVITVTSLPDTGVANAIYRLAGTDSYTDYSWNGSTFVPLATYDYGVDAEPTAGSHNLTESNGINEANMSLIKDMSDKMTSYTVEYYSIQQDGTFATSQTPRHVCFPVKEGEKYLIVNGGSSNICRYAFATSKSASSGGAVPLVGGTSVMVLPAYSSTEVTIPSGCSHFLMNAVSNFSFYTAYSRFDKVKNVNNYCIDSYHGEHTIAANETDISIIPQVSIKGGAAYLLKVRSDRDLKSSGGTSLRVGVSGNSAIELIDYLCTNPIWVSKKTYVSVLNGGRIYISTVANQLVGAKIYVDVYVLSDDALPVIGSIDGVSSPFTIATEDARYGDFSLYPLGATKRIVSCVCTPDYVKKKQGGIMTQITYPYVSDSANPIGGAVRIFRYEKDNMLVSYPSQDFESPLHTMRPLGYTTPGGRGWIHGLWVSANTDGNVENQSAYPYLLEIVKGHRYVIYAKSESLITPVDQGSDVSIRIGLGSNDAFTDEEDERQISPESLYNGVYLSKTAHTTAHSSRIWISMNNGLEGVNVDVYVQDRTEDIVCQDIKYALECSKPPKLNLPYRGDRIEAKYIALGIPYMIKESTSGSEVSHYSEGCAIYGNYIFKLFAGGYCVVYDISDYKNYIEIARFPLGSYSLNPENHANSAQFGNTVAEESRFPLLYVETNGPSIEGRLATTYVEKIVINGGVWSSETVQTIYVDEETISEINNSSVREDALDVFSESDIMLYAGTIGDDNRLHSIGYDITKQILHILEWRLPSIDVQEYRMSGNDVLVHCIKQNYDREVYVNQGHCFYNNQHFQLFGGLLTDSNIEVYNMSNEYTVGDNIDVKTIIGINNVYGEPEDLDVHCENLITSFNHSKWLIEIK